MSRLEERLEQAAHEVRQTARHSVPPPIETGRRPGPGGWLVFAAAFVAVVVAIGVLPLLSRSGDPDPANVAQPTTTRTTIPTETTRLGTERADCSAAGMAPPAEQEGLPAPVAEARLAIAAAAIACDYSALEALAAPNLITSFDGGGFDNLVQWEDEGSDPLATLVELFDTPYAIQDIPENPLFYVWPSAFIYDTWEDIPAADLEALREIYTQEELDQIATIGSYAGWRIGISETGEWRFFVAGD